MDQQKHENEQQQQQQQQPQQTRKPRWLVLAIASGAFAAMNGLFAKLYAYPTMGIYQLLIVDSTTDAQTGTLMKFLNTNDNAVLELVIRGVRLSLFPFPSLNHHSYKRNNPKTILIKTDLPCPEHAQQHNNVGALHARPHCFPLHNQSLHHQHVGEFPGYGVAGDACF
jgi:hypothetical protein